MCLYESIREPGLREILRFWLERRPGGGVPKRSSIGPAAIPPHLLPHLFLYAREMDGRFRCKLIGTELVRIFGGDQTGRRLDELLPPAVARQRARLFQQALDTGRPICYRGLAITISGDQRRYERILLPVTSSGPAADQVFGMARYGPVETPLAPEIAERAYATPTQIFFAAKQDLELAAAVEPAEAGTVL